MFSYRFSDSSELDDTTPLPELTLYDLLEPSSMPKEQHFNAAHGEHVADDDNIEDDEDAAVDDDDDDLYGSTANDSLNTPGRKKGSTVRILENKRLISAAPISTGLKNILGGPIRVLTTTPTKTTTSTQGSEVKILNKVQMQPPKAMISAPVKIGSTTIATGASTSILSNGPKNLNLTQIKTADGKLFFLQKSLPGTGGGTGTTRLLSQSQNSSGGIRQTAILPKGVTLASTGLIKGAATSTSLAAVRGLTTLGAAKATPSTATTTTAGATTINTMQLTSSPGAVQKLPTVLRTVDGKLITLNQPNAMLLNAKTAPVGVRTTATIASLANNNTNNAKSTGQVIIKGPLKQMPAGASLRNVINSSNSSSSGAATQTTIITTTPAALATSSSSSSSVAATTTVTLPAGKMLLQSATGKQIVVPSKNIIKLSPKPGTSPGSSAVTNANTTSNAMSSGLHAIQLPGRSGVQYVRVLPNNPNTNTSSSSKVTTSPQKVPLGRPRTSSNSTNNSNNSPTVAVSNTNKIVMKTMGGSIVPLPSMQTLVPRRTPGATAGATHAKTSVRNNSSLEALRKHRLSDLNVQIKQLTSDGNGDAGGPEAKKARYVIAMPTTSATAAAAGAASKSSATTTPATQKLAAMRSPQVQRVTVQGANVGSGSSTNNATRKVYNLVTKSDANGVKYMICNKSGEGKTRAVFNTTMRRGYTLADPKLRRPQTLSAQQIRLKQMKLQQQRQVLVQSQAKPRLQQQQQQQQKQQTKPQQQGNKSSVPAKPLFDILKPPAPPTPPVPAPINTLDALGGSRRKHCNCSKSQCLKLYCDCFANGEFCQDCTCKDCFNNLDYEVKRERAIRSCLERNPSAFKPKITAPNSGDMRLHNKGCNCKRSGCLKNYCECYEAKIPCSGMCKCVGCRNMEDRPDVDMDSIDCLTDAKSQANKMKEINGKYSQDIRSNVYLTDDVIEATIMCMISRIVMHEKNNLPIEDTEREVMEELGESLNQIITFAKEKNDTVHMDDSKTTA